MEFIYLKAFDNMESWYFEVTRNGTTLRQIVVEANGHYIASNRKNEEHHFFLTDQEVDFGNSAYIQITKTEFDKVWKGYTDTLKYYRNRTKEALPIGAEVTGCIEVFYPQGVIVNIVKNNAVGVADESTIRSDIIWLMNWNITYLVRCIMILKEKIGKGEFAWIQNILLMLQFRLRTVMSKLCSIW